MKKLGSRPHTDWGIAIQQPLPPPEILLIAPCVVHAELDYFRLACLLYGMDRKRQTCVHGCRSTPRGRSLSKVQDDSTTDDAVYNSDQCWDESPVRKLDGKGLVLMRSKYVVRVLVTGAAARTMIADKVKAKYFD